MLLTRTVLVAALVLAALVVFSDWDRHVEASSTQRMRCDWGAGTLTGEWGAVAWEGFGLCSAC